MSTDDDDGRGGGYGRPPVAHRFKKGVSGNPKGRPRKKLRTAPPPAPQRSITDLILSEAKRPVQVRENGNVTEMPMLQAAMRSLGVTAMKGNHRAATQLLDIVKAAQEESDRFDKEFERMILSVQQDWPQIWERMQAAGMPAPIPHPLDWKWDPHNNYWGVLGPIDRKGLELECLLIELRNEAGNRLGRVGDARWIHYKHGELYAEEYEAGEMLLDEMNSCILMPSVRRQPSFDLDQWKAEHPGRPKLYRKGIPSFGPMRQYLKDRYNDPPLATLGPEFYWPSEWNANQPGGELDFSELFVFWLELHARYAQADPMAGPPRVLKRYPDPYEQDRQAPSASAALGASDLSDQHQPSDLS